jgi:uncharacterized protein YdeI (YjbR/CyaY-like superfamily)
MATMSDVTFFDSSADFRTWLEAHHDQVQELWVGFYKKNSGKAGITYLEAVDEALCFGWIDGIKKRVDDDSYTNRFTPRKARSNWSEVNIQRVGELAQLGRMHPAGLKAFDARDQEKTQLYSYEARNRPLDEMYEKSFRANKKAWDFFIAQAPSYQKVAGWWVMSAKREETRLKRLTTLIEDSENRRRLAQVTYAPKT